MGHPLVSEGFDLTMTVPLALSYCSFFVFGHGISFFGGFQHPPVDQPVVQQPMVIVVLSEEMSTRPSTPPSWTRSLGTKIYDKHRHYIKKESHYLSYGFFSNHVWMGELDHKEGWVLKNWCFLTVVLEKNLESPLNCKEIKPVNPEGNQSWIFIGRTDSEAEVPILWPPDTKSRLTGEVPDTGKDWR